MPSAAMCKFSDWKNEWWKKKGKKKIPATRVTLLFPTRPTGNRLFFLVLPYYIIYVLIFEA